MIVGDRRVVLLPPNRQSAPVFQVRQDLCSRFVAHLEHRGFKIVGLGGGTKTSDKDSSAVAEVRLAAGTPLDLLATAQSAFLAQLPR